MNDDLNIAACIDQLPSRKEYLADKVDRIATTRHEAVEYATMCAEESRHIWDYYMPDDHSIAEALDTLRRWLEDQSLDNLIRIDTAHAKVHRACARADAAGNTPAAYMANVVWYATGAAGHQCFNSYALQAFICAYKAKQEHAVFYAIITGKSLVLTNACPSPIKVETV